MKINIFSITFVLVSFILPLKISQQEQTSIAANVETVTKSPATANQDLKTVVIPHDSDLVAKGLSPKISFEKTVCDLGDVGQGTKNTCEFRFTNTGQALLKIGKITRTCGCTVFSHTHLPNTA